MSGPEGTERDQSGDNADFFALDEHPRSPFRSWQKLGKEFLDRHREWYESLGDGPVYALPEEVIAALESPLRGSGHRRRPSRALIGPRDADAERAFAKICREHRRATVGGWNGGPIDYPLLGEFGSVADQVDPAWSRLNWDPWMTPAEAKSQIREGEADLELKRHQELGYVGRLICDARFQREKGELEARWRALDSRPNLSNVVPGLLDPPGFPAGSVVYYASRVLPPEESNFLEDLRSFLRKWGLARLFTWDLPLPQGPVLGVPMRLAMFLLGPDHLLDAIPSHHDLGTSPQVLKEIRARQGWAAREAGVEMEHPVKNASARGDSASRYENAFRMWLIEKTVLSRYPSARGRGLVARLLPVFARLFIRAKTSDGSVVYAGETRRLYSKYLSNIIM
jgi:hypothetical protein